MLLLQLNRSAIAGGGGIKPAFLLLPRCDFSSIGACDALAPWFVAHSPSHPEHTHGLTRPLSMGASNAYNGNSRVMGEIALPCSFRCWTTLGSLSSRIYATTAVAAEAKAKAADLWGNTPPPLAGGTGAQDYRRSHSIQVVDASGPPAPDPITSFDQAGFPPPLLRALLDAGYSEPTPIQAQGWPVANAGRDLVAIASTGSGKTVAYIIPALAHIREVRRRAAVEGSPRGGPTSGAPVLVLAPTRELAKQIEEEAQKFGGALGLRTACLFGGASRYSQKVAIGRAPHIIVATPGRLLDFAEEGSLDLTQVCRL